MDKIKFQDSVIELLPDDFNRLLISLLSERQRYEYLRRIHPGQMSYYVDVINQCDALIERFSECI